MPDLIAIITGASRGIGRATAVELSSRGWRVALAARASADLEETARLAKDSLAIPTDVRDPEQIDRLVKTTLDHFGRIDCIVNNAGLGLLRSITDITLDDWRNLLETNLSAAFYLCRAAWPHLVKQGGGVIVNISSPAADDPFPGLGYYGVAKAGLNLLATVLAREGAAVGIKVHTVAPGMTETGMFRGLFNEEQVSRDLTLDPADVARAIADCVTGRLPHASGAVLNLRK